VGLNSLLVLFSQKKTFGQTCKFMHFVIHDIITVFIFLDIYTRV